MSALSAIGFANPALLLALLALPVLWLVLRAVPPAPIQRRFPGVALLLGLRDSESETDKTPWWLLLLRSLAMAALILAFAGPVLNPDRAEPRSGPLLILSDSTWASARDWGARRDRIVAELSEARRQGRPVALVQLTDLPTTPVQFSAAEALLDHAAALVPRSRTPDPETLSAWVARLAEVPAFDTVWLSDGTDHPGREELAAMLDTKGAVRVLQSAAPLIALRPAGFEDGQIALSATRLSAAGPRTAQLVARGPDPGGTLRDLATAELTFPDAETGATAKLDLPAELRNRITRFELRGARHAGAVSLADDSLRRREIALYTGREGSEGLELLEPLHYLRRALAPNADLLELPLSDALPANPDVVILADVAQLAGPEQAALTEWVGAGGTLLRFAGPRLASAEAAIRDADPLLPVRLRAGGRSVGGAMSWGAPKSLRSFAEGSPFYGLPIPSDVQVTAQVIAEPGPDLPARVIAALADGTPLVTRAALGQGHVVLFHVTANAEWSTLPLSGLFVQMLERLSVSAPPTGLSAEALAGTIWQPRQQLSGFGDLLSADGLAAVTGEDLADAPLSARVPPGLYEGEGRVLARNVMTSDTELRPAVWPAWVTLSGLAQTRAEPLAGPLLAAALILLALDVIASLWLSGRMRGGAVAVLGLALLIAAPDGAQAQSQAQTQVQTQTQTEAPRDDSFALAATSDVVLGHVLTGDERLDDLAHAGLRGLSRVLYQRTSIEPAEPVAVDLEHDELSILPFLYWPVSADQALPSGAAYTKLNRYLRGGGMILFDTRDADIAVRGRETKALRKLQSLAAPLDVPPLALLPTDHVLTRTFYLLQDFPGRHRGRDLWVEAPPADAERVEGQPFRSLNDGVTPLVIGGNDWASAWAVDQQGRYLFPVGRGRTGERQRELAFRFGINLIMHVLTGNYKSDQVHVPTLLERLGE